ncbi:MAG: hypothetical protein JWP20_2810 [Roseomonas sp.]|jgi:hypothetical protein|nr:hypothetical protein [Roseomonas sp.]
MRPTATIPALVSRATPTGLMLIATLAALAHAAPAAAADSYGPWLLGCATDSMTDHANCRMTHDQPVEPATAGQSAMALEVLARGGLLVPAVTARDLRLDSAGRGLLAFTGTAQVRFPPHPMFEMPCRLEGRSVVCAPREADMARAADELARAQRVLVRVTGLGSGGAETEPKTLPLTHTAEALAALRERMPADAEPPAPEPGFDLRDLFLRLQRFFFAE